MEVALTCEKMKEKEKFHNVNGKAISKLADIMHHSNAMAHSIQHLTQCTLSLAP